MSEIGLSSSTRDVPILAARGVMPQALQPFGKQADALRWLYGTGWLSARSSESPEQMSSRERAGCRSPLRQAEAPATLAYGGANDRRRANNRRRSDQSARVPRQVLTPLDSVLTLSKLLADNVDRHLSPRQVDYAQTIYASVLELHALIDGLTTPAIASADACPDPCDAVASRETGTVVSPDQVSPMAAGMPQKYRRHCQPAIGGEQVAILESDDRVAAMMLKLVRDNGYQAFVVPRLGALRALVRKSPPNAIILGTQLGDTDGWGALDILRHDPATWPIPLCMVSINGRMFRWLQLGNSELSTSTADITVTAARESRRWQDGGGERPKLRGHDEPFSRVPLHGILSLESMQEIMSSGTEASGAAAVVSDITRYLSISYGDGTSDAVILRQSAKIEALLEGTMQFLHQAVNDSPQNMQDAGFACVDPILAGRKVLLIDDDIRHIYAMTGAFEERGMQVVYAEDGAEALAALQREPDMDAVLLDVVMAGVDAEDLLRRIRSLDAFRAIPVIALTGAGDCADPRGGRAHWLRAGASDDIARPANIEQLLSLLRVHLSISR